MQLAAREYPFSNSIVLHVMCVFTFSRGAFGGHTALIADDPLYVPSRCAQCIYVKNIAPVITFVLAGFCDDKLLLEHTYWSKL